MIKLVKSKNSLNIEYTHGDTFNLHLIEETTIDAGRRVRFQVSKTGDNNTIILNKQFSPTDNRFDITLTSNEAAMLQNGQMYEYRITYFETNSTIITTYSGTLNVVWGTSTTNPNVPDIPAICVSGLSVEKRLLKQGEEIAFIRKNFEEHKQENLHLADFFKPLPEGMEIDELNDREYEGMYLLPNDRMLLVKESLYPGKDATTIFQIKFEYIDEYNPELTNPFVSDYKIQKRYIELGEQFIPIGWTDWEDVFANVSYVDSINKKMLDIIDSAPEALNTLNELATALNNDPDFAATVINQLESKVDKEDGKGLSTEDYTTSEKESVKYLSSYFKQIPDGKTIDDLTEPGTYIGYENASYNSSSYTMPFILFVSNHNSLDEFDYAKTCQMRIYCNPLSEIGDNIMQCRLYENTGWTAWETIYATPQFVLDEIAKIPTGGGGETWELVASYTHSENRVIQPTALDMTTGYFTCENHGLVTGDSIIAFYNGKDQYNCPIPYELLLIANYNTERLYPVPHKVTVIDNDTFMITGRTSYGETKNKNIDVTKFHFETQDTDFAGFNNLNIDLNTYDVKIIAHDFGKRVNIKHKSGHIDYGHWLVMDTGHEYGLTQGIPVTPIGGVESYGSVILSLQNEVLYGKSEQYMYPISIKSDALTFTRTPIKHHYNCPIFDNNSKIDTLTDVVFGTYYDKGIKPKNGGWIQVWKRKK